MNKTKFLSSLKEELNNHNVLNDDIKIIVDDYNELYDDWLERGLTDEEVYEQLGDVKFIYQQLKKELKHQIKNSDKIISLTPFIAVIIFFILGFGFDLWQYGWLAFLIIPITAILINVKGVDKFIALTPFISVLTFYILGMAFSLWHPGWMIFLIIPISAIILKSKGQETIKGLGVFIIIITYLLLNFYSFNTWMYNYLIFLLIPIVAYLFKIDKKLNIIGVLLILASATSYIILLENNVLIKHALLVFLVPIVFGFINGDLKMIFKFDDKDNKIAVYGIVTTIIIYLIVSLLFDYWHITWLILLFIPMIGIYSTQRFKMIVPYMPFIATIIFILIGFLLKGWQYAWLAYLLIPMVAIIENSDSNKQYLNDAVSEEE